MKAFLIYLFISLVCLGCSKKEWNNPNDTGADKSLLKVTTEGVDEITGTSAKFYGNIEGIKAIKRGFCWGTSPSPVVSGAGSSTNGDGTGQFSNSISDLKSNTTFYVRAYATIAAGTIYGNEVSFITAQLPTLTTTAATSITQFAATSGGNITNAGNSSIISRGVCWSITSNPTIALTTKTNNGGGTGAFTSSITGLAPGTKYYVRAYATSYNGTAYGSEINLTTNPAVVPTLTTTAISNLTETSATSGGNITNDGGGTITARGVCWNTSENPTNSLPTKTSDGTGNGIFTSALSGFTPNTLYFARAYATNSAGTGYGNQVYFTIGVYRGGKVAYIFQSGDVGYIAGQTHGLIAAPVDQSTTAVDLTTALNLCNDLILNSYSDWYMPSKDELYRLYWQKEYIGGFTDNNYWSSTSRIVNIIVNGSNWSFAEWWVQNFANGYQTTSNGLAIGYNYIRAVRTF